MYHEFPFIFYLGIWDSFSIAWLSILCVFHLILISKNLTTNEWINWRKYEYLRSKDGYYNIFDKGVIQNFKDILLGGGERDAAEKIV